MPNTHSFTNNAVGSVLNNPLTDVETDLYVNSDLDSKLSGLSFPFWLSIWNSNASSPSTDPNNEIVEVSARPSAQHYTVSRGKQSTIASEHTLGSIVALLWTAGNAAESVPIGNLAQGSVYYIGSDGLPHLLPPGVAGTVFQTNGASEDPSWSNGIPASTDYVDSSFFITMAPFTTNFLSKGGIQYDVIDNVYFLTSLFSQSGDHSFSIRQTSIIGDGRIVLPVFTATENSWTLGNPSTMTGMCMADSIVHMVGAANDAVGRIWKFGVGELTKSGFPNNGTLYGICTDGTNFYSKFSTTTVYKYTISGSVATYVSTITLDTAVALSSGSRVFSCDGTYLYDRTNGTNLLRRFSLTGATDKVYSEFGAVTALDCLGIINDIPYYCVGSSTIIMAYPIRE